MKMQHPAIHIVSAVDAVANELRRRVLDGAYQPGAPLREEALAQELGVGRHTLRAALGTLAHEGILVRLPHRGVYVTKLSVSDVSDLFFVRAALEVEAVRTIVSRGIRPADALRRLQDLEDLPTDASWSDAVDADLALHAALVDAVGSDRLSRTYRTLASEIRLCISQLRPFYASTVELTTEHQTLLEAVMSNDVEIAISETRAHLRRAVDDLTRQAGA